MDQSGQSLQPAANPTLARRNQAPAATSHGQTFAAAASGRLLKAKKGHDRFFVGASRPISFTPTTRRPLQPSLPSLAAVLQRGPSSPSRPKPPDDRELPDTAARENCYSAAPSLQRGPATSPRTSAGPNGQRAVLAGESRLISRSRQSLPQLHPNNSTASGPGSLARCRSEALDEGINEGASGPIRDNPGSLPQSLNNGTQPVQHPGLPKERGRHNSNHPPPSPGQDIRRPQKSNPASSRYQVLTIASPHLEENQVRLQSFVEPVRSDDSSTAASRQATFSDGSFQGFVSRENQFEHFHRETGREARRAASFRNTSSLQSSFSFQPHTVSQEPSKQVKPSSELATSLSVPWKNYADAGSSAGRSRSYSISPSIYSPVQRDSLDRQSGSGAVQKSRGSTSGLGSRGRGNEITPTSSSQAQRPPVIDLTNDDYGPSCECSARSEMSTQTTPSEPSLEKKGPVGPSTDGKEPRAAPVEAPQPSILMRTVAAADLWSVHVQSHPSVGRSVSQPKAAASAPAPAPADSRRKGSDASSSLIHDTWSTNASPRQRLLLPPKAAANSHGKSADLSSSLVSAGRSSKASTTQGFDSDAFDVLIYRQDGARTPPAEVGADVSNRPNGPKSLEFERTYLPVNPEIHGMQKHRKGRGGEKGIEAQGRGGRKAWFGRAAEREMWLRAKEASVEATSRQPRPWSYRRPLDFSDVPSEDLHRDVLQDPAWLGAALWHRPPLDRDAVLELAEQKLTERYIALLDQEKHYSDESLPKRRLTGKEDL